MIDKTHEEIIKNYDENLVIIKRFPGGMSNYTYHVKNTTTMEEFVFRIKGDNGELFVDYKIEKQNLKVVKPLDINSETIYINHKNGTKISKYISGEMLSDNINYQKVSDTLKILHSSETKFENDYSPLQRLTKYEKLHKKRNQEYLDCKSKFLDLYYQILVNRTHVPCHNDAQIANFIVDTEDQYHLLDWEFAGNNDPLYDIASFGNKESSNALTLLDYYITNPTVDDKKCVYAWRMFQCLQWYNVAQAKHELNLSEKLHVPFDKVSDNYLLLANDLYLSIQKLK